MVWRYSRRSRRTDSSGLRFFSPGGSRRSKRSVLTPLRLGPTRFRRIRLFSRRAPGLEHTNVVYVNLTEDRIRRVLALPVISIVSNPNTVFQAKGYITRGSVLLASLNDSEVQVRVTSRPGQSGGVFGVIVS